jgi:hypothetical protein
MSPVSLYSGEASIGPLRRMWGMTNRSPRQSWLNKANSSQCYSSFHDISSAGSRGACQSCPAAGIFRAWKNPRVEDLSRWEMVGYGRVSGVTAAMRRVRAARTSGRMGDDVGPATRKQTDPPDRAAVRPEECQYPRGEFSGRRATGVSQG